MALSDTDYVSTLAVTDVVNSGTKLTATAVDNTGMSQGALYTLLDSIVTNWNLLMAKLEADGAATTTYTPNNLYSTLAARGIERNGMFQEDLVAVLSEMETKFKAVLALLDADTGVTLTTYTAVANAAGTGAALDLDNTVVGSKGMNQKALVAFLDDYVAKFNALLGNLDIDAL